ncbi:MAG TPA: glycosyl hydrolase [Armatimonadota bacterium]|nr:glycosyl hydrolase [Armatimonadota bacterium]
MLAIWGALSLLLTPASPFVEGAGEHLTCDLGRVGTVDRVVLVPRQLAHGYCARDFRIRVSTDGVAYDTVGTFHKPEGQQADAFPFAPVQARYVQLWVVTSWERAANGNNVQVAEMQVFGPDGRNRAHGARMSADTQEDRHPVEHANDGDVDTFWVSEGQRVNQVMWEATPEDVWPREEGGESNLAPGLYRYFRQPNNSCRPKMVWFINGTPEKTQVLRQLKQMKDAGLGGPALFAYKGLTVDYLGDAWFEMARWVADECARLGLDMWILDEGSYPSGFADGHVTDDHPEFRSKALRVAKEAVLADGEVFEFAATGEPVVGIVASRPADSGREPQTLDLTPLRSDAQFRWQCTGGPWHVQVFVQRLESHACRSISGGGRKDHTHSLPDYLRSDATARFLEVTHEQYERHIGAHFGNTVKGFFGDEPCLPRLPWTDGFLREFRRQKGYDLRPHLPALVGAPHPDREGIVYDYFDVLARLWTTGYYQPQTDWCASRGMTFTAHLCGEEQMMELIHGLNTDFFQSLSGVGEPGVDVIWRQVYFGCTTDFPRLGGSAANVWGKPRAMTESFAVFGSGTTYEQMKYVSDYQLVRSINDFFLMMWNYDCEGWRRLHHPPDLSTDSTLYPYLRLYSEYIGRASTVMATGTPIADVAVYYPTRSAWLGDGASLDAAHSMGRRLLERQRDFEWIDDKGLVDCCHPSAGGMRNLSGTLHRVFVIPPCDVISAAAADRVREFVQAGGALVCYGRLPSRFGGYQPEPTTLNGLLRRMAAAPGEWVGEGQGRAVFVADETAALAAIESAGPPRFGLREPISSLRLAGRDHGTFQVWFATNEGEEPIETELELAFVPAVEEWDAETGACRPVAPIADGAGGCRVPLRLCPRASRVFVFGLGRPAQPVAAGPAHELLRLDGEWDWIFVHDGNAVHRGPLALWSELGRPEYSGDVHYAQSFELASVPSGRVVLDLGRVRYMARVTLNGAALPARLWPPYAVDVTGLLRAGRNDLVVRVTNTPANRFFARPGDRAAAEARGWFEGTYVGTYEAFEADSIPSGLLGPVRLLAGGE